MSLSARSVLLEEKTLKSERIFKGNFLKLNRDTVELPDGKISTREYVVHPGAAVMMPLLDNGKVVMVRQWRHPLKREFLEFPAGKIDAGEAPIQTAQRELVEECGYLAADWEHVTTIHPILAYCDERIELFLAKNLTKITPKLDDGEFLEVLEVEPGEALQWVREGKITDSKTMIGLFWLDKLRSGQWQPGKPDAQA